MIDDNGNLIIKATDLPILVSTNDMYIPTLNRKTHHCFLRSSNELLEFQSRINEMFKQEVVCTKSELDDFYNNNQDTELVLILNIYLPKRIYFTSEDSTKISRKDCSNLIKAIEDSISSNLGIDDRYNKIVLARKLVSNNDKYGFVAILSSTNYYSSINELMDNISLDSKGEYSNE